MSFESTLWVHKLQQRSVAVGPSLLCGSLSHSALAAIIRCSEIV